MNTTTSTSTNPPEEVVHGILQRIVESITLHKQEIKVTPHRLGRSATTFAIQVHRGDMGRVIGSKGVHKEAMKHIAKLIGKKHGRAFDVEFLEPVVGEKDRFTPFQGSETWPGQRIVQLATDLAQAIFDRPVKVDVYNGPNFTSAIEILVSPREQTELVHFLIKELEPLFDAIGKSCGRHLKLNILPEGEF